METLILLLLISSTNLVLSDENVAIENGAGYQVHAPPEETDPEFDQQAEGSQIITHAYGGNMMKNVRQSQEVDETLKYSDEGQLSRNGDVRYTYEVQNVHQQPQQQGVQYLHENIRQKPIVVNDNVHSNQVYSHQQQQLGVQQFPSHQVQMYTNQASPPQQAYQNEHTIGYQTFVEHPPEGDDEEIKSALKENSLGDIKRLVPKSGISFKIYHNEKSPNLKVTEQRVETHSEVPVVNIQTPQGEFQNSVLHHRLRVQVPVQQIQTSEVQSVGDKPQGIYLQQNIGYGNQVSSEGQTPHAQVYYVQQEVSSPRPVAYTQQDINSPRPVAYIQSEVSSPRPAVYTQEVRPGLEIPGKGAADASYKIKIKDEHVRPTSKIEYNRNTVSGHRQDPGHIRHQPRKNFHKTIKPKPDYQKELTEGVQKLTLSHNEGFPSHEGGDVYVKANYPHLVGQEQLHGDSKAGQPILNRLSGSYINEGLKGSVVTAESQYKTTHDNEVTQHGLQFDTKSSPNNFDHQKALEGSTSFDIKNAIGNTEGVEAQGYITTTEIHPSEELQKHVAYNVPTVLIENSILKSPVDLKTFPHTVPQFAYHPQEITGKFYQQPQFIWTSEQFKQGPELSPILKLHLPKEEIQYVKAQKVEIPSMITHQPLIVHQNAPHKGLQFQHKKHSQGYQKLPHPVIIDWSLFKSKFPNVNINNLATKPELVSYLQDPNKKIMPILVRKRKNRSNKEVGVVYGKTSNRGPAKPSQRQEKNVRVSLVPSASNDVKFEAKGDRKNEFSVSASYKVDRSYKSGS